MASTPATLRSRAPVLGDRRPQAAELEERKLKPVKWFAAFGIAVLAVQAWTYAQWIASGDVGPAPAGPTEIPNGEIIAARIWEGIGLVGALLALIFLVIRPWRRTGRISTDGMFVVIFFQLWSFQDAFANYTVPLFQYNAAFVDVGSWYSYIPGWMSANAGFLAEPILFVGGLYVWLFACGMIFLNWVQRRAKRRWPRMGKLGLILVAIGTAAVIDFVFEVAWLRQGLYSYGGHINEVTLFPSHRYAFPIYEAVLWGITWGTYASLRYFRNDKGEMVAERGLSEVKASPRRKQWLRFLALLGAVNLGMLVLYNLPYQATGLWADSIPRDVTKRSYMTSGVCGIGTDRACIPSSRLPYTTKESQAHFTPTGEIVAPDGVPVEPRAIDAPPITEQRGTGWP